MVKDSNWSADAVGPTMLSFTVAVVLTVPTILWNGTELERNACSVIYLFYGTVSKHALDNYPAYNIHCSAE